MDVVGDKPMKNYAGEMSLRRQSRKPGLNINYERFLNVELE